MAWLDVGNSIPNPEGRIGEDKRPPQPAVSRILSLAFTLAGSGAVTIIPLNPSSLTGFSGLPGGLGRAVPTGVMPDASLFGLAPCGVLPATRVTTSAVRSYRTFSPLPASALTGFGAAGLTTCRWLCIFCATFLQVALTGR